MAGPFGFTNAFTSGELDENAWDRTDIQQVAKGCAQALNTTIQVAGPLAKRPGFWFVGPVADNPHATRIVAFRKSWADSCLLEFGDRICHVWQTNGQPVIDTVLGGQLSFVTPILSATLPGLRWKQVQDVIYFRSVDGMVPQSLSRRTGGTSRGQWTFAATTFTNGPWLAENGNLALTVTLTNTSGPADILDGNPHTGAGAIPAGAHVTVTANFNLFDATLVGSQMRVRANADSLSCHAWSPAQKYALGAFVTSIGNMYNCSQTGTTGSGSNPPVQPQGYQSDGDNGFMYLHDGAGVISLTGYTSPTVMTGTVLRTCPIQSATPTSYWAFNAYSVADGYPTAWPEIREERLVDGATSGNWDYADLTQTAGFNPTSEDFTPGTGLGVIVDTNAVRRRVGAKGGRIQWFREATYLLVGTETGEHLISGPVLDEPISPSGVVVKPLSDYGCAPIEPANSQRGLMFVTITGRSLREIGVDPNQGTFGEDHSYLAKHIATLGFANIKWTKAPSNNLWCQMNDGSLACYTYHVEQQVKGFTSQQIASGGFTVIDMAVLPSVGNYESLWLVVQGAGGSKYILRLSDPGAGLHMDLAVGWAGAASNVIPVNPLMEGWTVDVLAGPPGAGAAWYKGLVVTGGQVTLPNAATATMAQVGLTYPVAFTSLKLDLRNLYGGALLQAQQIKEALVDVETVLCTVGGNNPNWPGEDISVRLATDVPGVVPQRVTRRVTIVQDESSETDDHDPRITITEQTPYPFVLYAIRQDKVAVGE